MDAARLEDDLRAVSRIVRHLVQDGQVAEDLAHDAWLVARKAPPPAGVGRRSWLAGVARNLALRLVRTETNRALRQTASARSEASVESPSEVLVRAETHRRVVDAVLALREPFRETVLLRFFEELSAGEIGSRTGVSSATVRSRLHRGLEMIRERLDRDDDGDRRRWALPLLALVRRRTRMELVPFAGALAVKKTTSIAVAALLLLLIGGTATFLLARGPEVGGAITANVTAPVDSARSAKSRAHVEQQPAIEAPSPARSGPIRVVDPDGAAVADAEVDFVEIGPAGPGADEPATHAIGRTERDGRVNWPSRSFHFPGIVRASHEDFASATAAAPSRDADVLLRLGRGLTIEGDVVTSAGEPVARARVEMTLVPSTHAFGVIVGTAGTLSRKTTSATDGSFRLRALASTNLAIVSAHAEGFGEGSLQWPSPQQPGRLRLVLRPSPHAVVRVTDRSGRALPGATVVLFDGPMFEMSKSFPRLRTVALRDVGDGSYASQEVAEGWYSVLVGHPGHHAAVKENVAFARGLRPVEVVLDDAPSIAGRIVDSQTRRGIAGAVLRVAPVRPGDRAETTGGQFREPVRRAGGAFAARTAVDGGFTWTTAALEDDVVLTAEAEGYAPYFAVKRGLCAEDLAEIPLVPVPCYVFTGRAVTPGGEPVAGAIVRGDHDAATTGGDGSFELSTRQRGRSLIVFAPGFTSPYFSEARVDVAQAEAIRVDVGNVVLSPLVKTTGVVVDEAGKPRAGVRVFSTPVGASGTSDDRGVVELPLIPGVSFSIAVLSAWDRDSTKVDVVGGAPFRLVVQPASAPTGTIRGHLRMEDGNWDAHRLYVAVRSRPISAAVGPFGDFEFTNLAGGSYELLVRNPAEGIEADPRTVTLAEGEVMDVTIACRRIPIPQPNPTSRVRIRVENAPLDLKGWITPAGGNGRDLRRSQPGSWSADVTLVKSWTAWFMDVSGMRAAIVSAASPEALTAGAVLAPAGRLFLPVPERGREFDSRVVVLFDAARNVVWRGQEDALPLVMGEGYYLLLPPGSWNLEISSPRGGTKQFHGSVVAGTSSRAVE